MSQHPEGASRALPERPNLRFLKDEAKLLVRTHRAATLADGLLQIAREYGFRSWPRLKDHVEGLNDVGLLKAAIVAEDLGAIRALMTARSSLHRAPLGYGQDGPLTWVAECRVPWQPPSTVRLEIARWMLEHGSDVHQGGDGPLMRAALKADRIPMMQLLVAHGGDVNARWHGHYSIIYAPCETLDPAALRWLLDHGADPNCGGGDRDTALDYLIGGYIRNPALLQESVDMLLDAGARTRYAGTVVLMLLRGHLVELEALLHQSPELLGQRFPELDIGRTAGRSLSLEGGTMLHVAAEFGSVTAATLLLDRGADVNARALIGERGAGGQTPIFHSATQFGDAGIAMTKLLLDRGADLTVRATIPGRYNGDGALVTCTALGYALMFPEGDNATVALLRARGAVE